MSLNCNISSPKSAQSSIGHVIHIDQIEGGNLVGFSNLPDQVHRKSVKKGFELTIMVVGECGLGKSTLIKSLFYADIYENRKKLLATERIENSLSIQPTTVEIEEKGIRLRLTVIDTPGYCDSINSNDSWLQLVKYIDDQFESFFINESAINRKNIVDTRVHCCLYFLNPVKQGLKPLDIITMKHLDKKVSIIPIIAKSDMLTVTEVATLKAKIKSDIIENNIEVYKFPECEDTEDSEFYAINFNMKKNFPFAIVSSDFSKEINGKKVRGREYPWGFIEIENPMHCDFSLLRDMLIRTHTQDLKDVTHDIHYENFRANKLTSNKIHCNSHK